MSVTESLAVALRELAVARDHAAAVREVLAGARREFDEANAELIASVSEHAARVAEAEEQVRSLAVVAHDLTGEKKPVPGAEVVIRTTYRYDAADALAWAETALPTAITRTLDTKAIDKIASTGTLPFATKVETPSVRIATDLTSYLTETTAVEVSS